MKERACGLGGQITSAMVAAAVASAVMAITGLYLFYGIVLRFAPELLPPQHEWLPNGLLWAVILLLCLAAAGIAALFSVRLARRILAPLISVAESARAVADGNLAARAIANDRTLSEAALLVDNFNLLADRLERASTAVRHWNAAIAHELRTPVTILSGRLHGLADGVFEPEPQLFRSLVGQAGALARLIDDLRTVSLFETEHFDMQFRQISLADEIGEIVDVMRPAIESAGFRIESMLDQGVCTVDVGRIRQALVALIENAKRHATPGMLSVHLRIDSTSTRISVSDQGPGLAEDFAAYAFDRFRRYMEDGETPKGTGLGLSVVMAIAQAHGGQAIYEPSGGGSRFTIIVPRYRFLDPTQL